MTTILALHSSHGSVVVSDTQEGVSELEKGDPGRKMLRVGDTVIAVAGHSIVQTILEEMFEDLNLVHSFSISSKADFRNFARGVWELLKVATADWDVKEPSFILVATPDHIFSGNSYGDIWEHTNCGYGTIGSGSLAAKAAYFTLCAIYDMQDETIDNLVAGGKIAVEVACKCDINTGEPLDVETLPYEKPEPKPRRKRKAS